MAQSGQRIGEYVLEEMVGRGAFGEVWRARHHVWADHVVAVKIPTDLQYLKTLQREGKAIHGLVHPNIVRALGFDPYAQTPYLMMEYVEGSSLRDLIRNRKITPSDAVTIMKQVLAGLAHAHQAGIIHGDIKPENVLIANGSSLQSEGAVKVTDFGLGRAMARGTDNASIVYSTADSAKEISGSLDYMAPEQRSGAEIDVKTDLYSCGVVFYEMLTGERPAGTEVPSEVNPQVPKTLDEIFKRAYARRERRFASAAEFSNSFTNAGRTSPPPLPKIMRMTNGVICAHCRRHVDVGDQFCIHCGMQLVPKVRRCGKCGAYPDRGDTQCLFCGHNLEETTTPVRASEV